MGSEMCIRDSCKRDRWPRNEDKNVKVRIDDQYQPVSRGILLEAGRVNKLKRTGAVKRRGRLSSLIVVML